MNTLASLTPLTTKLLEIQHLASAASVLSWDQETYMPGGGGAARADQISTLQALAHDRLVSSEVERLLSEWVDPSTGRPIEGTDPGWDESARALLREVWRDFSRAKKLPSEFVARLAREASLSQQAWVQARASHNFAMFLPHLRTIVDLKKQEADYLGYERTPYDALIDAYEPGATVAQLTPLFSVLKDRLVPLLNRVKHATVSIDDAMLYRSYDTARQIEFGRLVLTAMGYDFDRGRMDLSAHPFTTSFHPTDVRVTTRVHEKELPSCLFSCIHEGGHGLYDQGLDASRYGTPLGESLSLGIHESQSRLWENSVGRGLPFWSCFYPLLQQCFPDQLHDVPLDRFHAAINRVKPSLIRVEADELTYNLHIMLRFEIEQDLIEGRIRVDDLPAAWNEKTKAYLGLTPPNDGDGVLQDVHWSMGAIGYFPTYTLGNLYAAQLYEQAHKDMPGLDADIRGGRLSVLTKWLNQKVHRWGRMFPAEQLMMRITGRPLSPEPFLTYLETKLASLYRLEGARGRG